MYNYYIFIFQMSVDFITTDMSGVSQQINHLNATINDDRSKNQILLEQQNEVKEILDKEKDNIQKKIDHYNKITETGIRDAVLKKNGSQRLKQYNKIFFILTFTVAILIILYLIEKNFPFVPESILTIARIAVIAISIIICSNLNDEINSRDPIDYDKLNLEKPNVDTPEELEKKRKQAAKDGDLLGSIDMSKCKGPQNCGEGTKWDNEKMLCVPVLEESFENIIANEPQENYKKL